ncbi:MAG: CoA pyrophosphatase [Deltaproteobacteria bacterium]|nr:CoA pyrophosphatase [Deltaproteobacteria bacterium]
MYNQKGLPDLIKQTLNSREPKLIHDLPPNYRHAGVLIPLLVEEGVHKVLFTKRTHTVEHHKGQISFPGGAADDEDKSKEDTALRESYEEIGLLREDVEVLGRIDDIFTIASSFIVHPFVGFISGPYDFEIQEIEVKRLIKVPWDILIKNNLENKTYTVESAGTSYQTPAFEFNGDVIWGATAWMMTNFIEILKNK